MYARRRRCGRKFISSAADNRGLARAYQLFWPSQCSLSFLPIVKCDSIVSVSLAATMAEERKEKEAAYGVNSIFNLFIPQLYKVKCLSLLGGEEIHQDGWDSARGCRRDSRPDGEHDGEELLVLNFQPILFLVNRRMTSHLLCTDNQCGNESSSKHSIQCSGTR